jgi:pilus assembly protein Flp/PilA
MFKRATSAIIAPALRLWHDDSGATSIEYAMIASGIGVVLAATIVNLGTTVKGLYTGVSTALK